jgi:hypothetical protein
MYNKFILRKMFWKFVIFCIKLVSEWPILLPGNGQNYIDNIFTWIVTRPCAWIADTVFEAIEIF